jgi:hypothetical protein
MKSYALYLTNASNHNRLITKDTSGNPFTEQSAREYAEGISGNTVCLIHMSKPLEILKR